MAEIFPEEGLDIILGQFPKNATRLTSTYLCLFTNFTASTVMAAANTMADVIEAAFTNYARQELASATWGAQADESTTGRSTTYPQVSFPAAGSSETINGFFISDILSTTGDKVICMANFDDTTAAALTSGDVIKVTPKVQFNH